MKDIEKKLQELSNKLEKAEKLNSKNSKIIESFLESQKKLIKALEDSKSLRLKLLKKSI